MYTHTSKLYNESMRLFVVKCIREYRPIFEETYFKDSLVVHQSYLKRGQRFVNDEECFQAFCMEVDDLYNKSSKTLTQDLFIVEFLGQMATTKNVLFEIMEATFLNAAGCDYYYSYEKNWD